MNKMNTWIIGKGSFGQLMESKYVTNRKVHVIRDGELLKKNTVIELCVPNHVLLTKSISLIRNGFKNIILPKPLPIEKENYVLLKKEVKKNNVKVVVSSQWAYSKKIERLVDIYQNNQGIITEIDITFNQSFDPTRLSHYTQVNCLLPHMIQIIVSMKINPTKYRFNVIEYSPHYLLVHGTPRNIRMPFIRLSTNINSKEKVRVVKLYNSKGLFHNCNLERSDDMLSSMINHHVDYFVRNKKTDKLVTLDRYDSIQRVLIDIQEQVNRR